MEYAVLPAGCTMSVREFLSDRARQTVHVHETSLASTHGRFGKLSKHAMAVQVQKLKCMDFVCTQRIATGRALDALCMKYAVVVCVLRENSSRTWLRRPAPWRLDAAIATGRERASSAARQKALECKVI
jgi:hypothetical protein